MSKVLYRTIFKRAYRKLIFFLYLSIFSLSSYSQEGGEDFSLLSQKEKEDFLEKEILPTSFSSNESSSLEISIESSDLASTFIIEKQQGEDSLILLEGDVLLFLKDKKTNTTHKIQADFILWNETQKTLFARDNLSYLYSNSGQNQLMKGDSLYLDWDNQEFFIEGVLGQTSEESSFEDFYFSFGGKSLKAKSLEGLPDRLLFIRDGFVTTSDINNPYYRLEAKKIWIIGEEEWAVLGATLYMGEVPIFYFPYYFHTNKKIFFYPQIGFDPYRGAFLNTTTYLIGEKTNDLNAFLYEDNLNISNFYKTKREEGIWLSSTDSLLESLDYLKLIVDLYFNLGAYLAVDFVFSEANSFNRGHFGLGFSRTLYPHSGDFFYPFPEDLPNKPTFKDRFDINKTYFFGLEIPLRWVLFWENETTRNNWKFSFKGESYSDSYVYRDFLSQRTENSSPWMSFVLTPYSPYLGVLPNFDYSYSDSGALWDFEIDPLVTFYSQNFTLLYEKENLDPFYLKEIRWEILRAGLFWTAHSDDRYSIYSPSSSWFFLKEAHFPQTQFYMRGALWEWENKSPYQNSSIIVSSEKEEEDFIAPLAFEKEFTFEKPKRDSSFGLYYIYKPYLDISASWNTDNWLYPYEANIQDVERFSAQGSDYFLLEGIGAFWGKYLVVTSQTNLLTNWTVYMYEQEFFKNSRYTTNNISLEETFSLGSYFFQDYYFFKNSYISQTLSFTLFSFTQSYQAGIDSQEWGYLGSKNSLNKNETELYLEFSGRRGGLSHSLKIDYPYSFWKFEEKIKGWLDFYPFKAETSWGYSLYNGDYNPYLWNSSVIYQPLSNIYVQSNFYWNMKEGKADSFDFFFKVFLFELGLYYKDTTPYDFNSILGEWEVREGYENGETLFMPYKLRLALVGDIYKTSLLKGRGVFFISLDTGYESLLNRFTENEFWFKWSIGFRLNNFTEFTLSSFSNNTQMFRYSKRQMNQIGYPDLRISFWKDLWKSLSFWDRQSLKDSNFKWQWMELRMRQVFYDWYWQLTWQVGPYRYEKNGIPEVSLKQSFSLSVQWTPMRSIRSYLVKEKENGYSTGIGEDP